MRGKRRAFLWIFCGLGAALLLLLAAVLGINAYVRGMGEERILSREEAVLLEDVDCILVLGCLVRSDGSPSDMLADRLDMGVALYEAGMSEALLVSGDHGREEYDEVNAMKAYAVSRGVPAEDVFMDHAGFSTYESVIRAKEVFGAERVVIVSQEYHLSRALYLAKAMEIEAWGVAADTREYRNQWVRDLREVMARCKDFFVGILRPDPTYLGESVDLSGDANQTNG